MLYIVAILAGFGGFAIGWCVGLALFAVAFEVLRQFDRDILLDSTAAWATFRFSAAAIGFAIGAWLTWQWRPRPTSAWWMTLVIAVLAGVGGTVLTLVTEMGSRVAALLGRRADTILFDLGLAVLAWIAGALLAVIVFDRAAPIPMRIFHGALGIVGALALIFAGLLFDFRLGNRYPFLGQPRIAMFEVRMPPTMRNPPPLEGVRVTMRTGTTTVQGHDVLWLRQDGFVILSGRIDISERTRDRTLIISIPDMPELTVRMRFVSNPPVMYQFGRWLRVGPNDDILIRFLTRRTI